MANLEIRQAMARKRLKHYEVAQILGVSPFTFSRWMRDELPVEKKEQIMKIIEEFQF